jgi:hypothetical protein
MILKVNFISLNKLRHYELDLLHNGYRKAWLHKTRVEECGVRLRVTGMIVKQNGWVWVIGKGNEVSLGKKKKDYTDLRRWNGDKKKSVVIERS